MSSSSTNTAVFMNKKALYSTIGVIFLGALGSGLWDLTKPFLASLASYLANFSTLGFDTLREDLYVRAARSLGQYSSFGAAGTMIDTWIAFLLAGILHVLSISRDTRVAKFAQAYMLLCFALALGFGVQAIKSTYALQLANYYETLEVIASPYLSDREIKQYRSSFSQIQSKAEYGKVIDSISAKIRQNGGTVPPHP
jgi:hypothetical protein